MYKLSMRFLLALGLLLGVTAFSEVPRQTAVDRDAFSGWSKTS
jgi:hypothetical protein